MSSNLDKLGFQTLLKDSLEERSYAREQFLEHGIPGPRSENWKYTRLTDLGKRPWQQAESHDVSDLDQLLERADSLAGRECYRVVLVNGFFVPELSRLEGLPQGAHISELSAADQQSLLAAHKSRSAEAHRHPLDSLNAALFVSGVCIRLDADVILDKSLHVVQISGGQQKNTTVQSRHLLELSAGAKMELLESVLGQRSDEDCFGGRVTDIRLDANASLEHIRLQSSANENWQYTLQLVQQQENSTFKSLTLSLDGTLIRNESRVLLLGEKAHCELASLSMLDGNQHVDNHTWLDHAVPKCTSDQNFRSVLSGSSRSVFTGHILVRQDAQLTDAIQNSKALLLSDKARANARPQLEIYADDVKCTHGSTIGSLEEEQLFYLSSRGIDAGSARRMLVRAFGEELLQSLRNEGLRQNLLSAMAEGFWSPHA